MTKGFNLLDDLKADKKPTTELPIPQPLMGDPEPAIQQQDHNIEVKESLTIEWKPKKDITLYELACLLPHLMGVPLFEEGMKKMGRMARHFKRAKNPDH